MGTIIFLFFRSLSKVENLSSRTKTCHLPCLLHQNQNRIYPSQNSAFWGIDITHLKISPTFVLFGHIVRCSLQYHSLLSILCTSKYIYYLILHFCYQKRCENTMFFQLRYSKMHYSFQDLKSNMHMYGAAAGLSLVELQSWITMRD